MSRSRPWRTWGGLQLTDDVLAVAVWVVEDELDRLQGVCDAAGGRASPAHKLGQLAAQCAIKAFLKAREDVAALVSREAEAIIVADRDLHAGAYELAVAIRAAPPGRRDWGQGARVLMTWPITHALAGP